MFQPRRSNFHAARIAQARQLSSAWEADAVCGEKRRDLIALGVEGLPDVPCPSLDGAIAIGAGRMPHHVADVRCAAASRERERWPLGALIRQKLVDPLDLAAAEPMLDMEK
jgi:hypothetical protein